MLLVHHEFQLAFQRLGLTSCDSVLRHFAAETSPSETVTVCAASLVMPDGPAERVFYKQYVYLPPGCNFIGRPSKARCEFENYEVFSRLGIPSATPVACGEERDFLGRLRRAFILTRAVPGAMTLQDFVQQRCANRTDTTSRQIRGMLVQRLAELTRRIHDAGFFHHDLVWRNILVTWSPPGIPNLWWIDCPRGRFARWGPWRHRWRLRDLASLDKVASLLCTPGERARFVKLYLGKNWLDDEVRRLIRSVLQFRKTRWPEDWK